MRKRVTKISLSFFSLFFLCSSLLAQRQLDSSKRLSLLFRRQLNVNYALIKLGYKISKPFSKKRVTYRKKKVLEQGYSLIWEDQFDSFNNKKWRKGQLWGSFNPGALHQYYSDDAVEVKNGLLYLWAYYQPERLSSNDTSLTIPFAIGLINSDQSFFAKQGYFEARCKLPAVAAAWPAFWLTGRKSWPPEIDIFENYGGKNGKTINKQTQTIHWGSHKHDNHQYIPRKSKIMRKGDTAFHIYACEWTMTSIRFFTDGKLIRKANLNPHQAFWMNQEMSIILNNGIEAKYLPKSYGEYERNALIVDWIRVYQKNNE